MKRSVLALVLLLAACKRGSAPAGAEPAVEAAAGQSAAQAATQPCNVVLPEGSGQWKLIEGVGFTMCVPAEWRVANTRATYAGGTIRWQNSQARLPFTVTSVRGAPSATSMGGNTSSTASTNVGRRQGVSEMIGGQMASIWSEEGNGRVGTGVSFRDPPLSITGEASGKQNVQLQLAVYRTIRFVR